MKVEPNLPSFSDVASLPVLPTQSSETNSAPIFSQELGGLEGNSLGNLNSSPKRVESRVESSIATLESLDNDSEEQELSNESNVEQNSGNFYLDVAQGLCNEGLINLNNLEESDYNFEEWTAENFSTLLKKSMKAEKGREVEDAKEKATEDAFNYLLDGMSDITRSGFEFEKNNPEPDDVKNFYKLKVEEYDLKSLNPNDSVDAEKILIEYYKSLNEPIDIARERVANLKDPISEAVKVKPRLDKKIEQIALGKIEEQNKIMAYDMEAKKGLGERVNKIFESKDLAGIPLTNEVRKFLRDIILEDEVPMKINGKSVTVGGAEALVRIHKYAGEQGKLEHLMKAMIYLHAPEFFEKTIIRDIQNRETNRMIKENKESKQIKAGITAPQLLKSKPKEQPKGMIFNSR